jgi:hypothetical protein
MAYSDAAICGTCKYWQAPDQSLSDEASLPHSHGTCQRRAPVLAPPGCTPVRRTYQADQDYRFVGVFPMTDRSQWCGEFERNQYATLRVRLRDLGVHVSYDRLGTVLDSLEAAGVNTVGEWLALGPFAKLRINNLGRKAIRLIDESIEQVLGIERS